MRIEAVAAPEASAIKLDGELSEVLWQRAPAITGFVQRDPKEGAPATFETEARVVYDATNLYVGVRAIDTEPGKIVGLLTRRDESSPSDWLRVLIDSYHDRRTAYEFSVNAAGVKLDRYWFNDGNMDDSWDAVWDVEVSRDDRGWKAEFRIPFSQLRFNRHDTGPFGFAVMRQIGRLNETSSWPLLSKAANGFVSSFGELGGVSISGSAKRLELAPYTVGQVKTDPDKENPLVNAADTRASVGLDLKFALTPGLTLTSTINPDFGQVEADPAVVNLSAFETFFSERRPFFVEGSGIFRFDINCNDGECTGLFYSRRIGRSPHGEADAPDGGFSVAPTQTTILGAAKVTGRVRQFSVGALNALTGEETATIADGVRRSKQVVEPATSYSVLRAKREFTNQSSVGFMMTATNRNLTDGVRFLPGQAYTGGVDWDWRLSKRYSLAGYWAGSNVRGEAEAIDELQQNSRHSFHRPDADYLHYDPSRTALNGQTLFGAIRKIGGEHVRFESNVGFKTPGFDINDLGFFRRADERVMSNWFQWRRDKPSKHLRWFRINFNQWSGWNFGGDHLFGGGNINAHTQFASNWQTGAGLNLDHRIFDDRLTRGGPGGLIDGGWGYWQYVDGDNRKPAFLNVFHYYGRRQGRRLYEASAGLTFRPASALSIAESLYYFRNTDDAQWVENVSDSQDHYIFGRLNQTTVALTTRVNYTITPTLSIQLYARPFVSAGDYNNFTELVNGRAPAFRDRYASFDYPAHPDFANPDFNVRSFRTTNVLRWEYKPGSTLFVVWQQGREDTLERGDFRFGRDFRGVFGVPARNVFLVKLAYWLNY